MRIIIDIREEYELKEIKLKPINENVNIINIPMRHIQFNLDYLNNLSKNGKLFILCKSGKRAGMVKNKYFEDNENIEVLEGGVMKLNDEEIEKVEGKKTKLGMQQYMQIMFLLIMILSLCLVFYNKFFGIIFIICVIIMILYQLLTKSCVLGKIMMKFD